MADREIPPSPQKTGPWTDELKGIGGDCKCFTNTKALSAESLIHFARNAAREEEVWLLDDAKIHPLGVYGWMSDLLMCGYAAHRHDGQVYIYRCKVDPEQYHGVE